MKEIRNTFKKIVCVMLAVICVFAVSSCGGESETENSTQTPTENVTEAPTGKSTETPTETPTEKPTETPTETPTEKPTETPTEAPTEKPTEAPTEASTEPPASVGLSYTSNGDGTCCVSGIGSCNDTNIVIPSVSPAGDTVTSIGYEAFYIARNLHRLRYPPA